jgi:hypothetical protein
MTQKQLLREWYAVDSSSNIIKESREKNGGKLMLTGIIQKANQLNQNKRIYPREILRREVENYQKAVREARSVGECDHPESSSVSLKNVSHVIREIWWDGDDVCGKVEVLTNLPSGKILEGLMEAGIKLGISSRGVGSTEKTNEGYDQVQDDYQIICWDMVSEPSTPGAYLFAEGKKIDFEPKRTFTRGDRIFRALNDIILPR